jgi:beta-galactosidase
MWGEDPNNPSFYFWGRTARDMAFSIVQWFARGGTHLNYYMWMGGYNGGRASGTGVMNGYATDAPVCASGQPRYPKFAHFQALHHTIESVARILLDVPTQLNNATDIEHINNKGEWEISGKQRMFVYRTNYTRKDDEEVIFVENESKESVVVRLPLGATKRETLIIEMSPTSAMIIKNGSVKFDSALVSNSAMAYQRKLEPGPVGILSWASCSEPIGALSSKRVSGSSPVEQTALNIDAGISSDYAWYETHFSVGSSMEDVSIHVGSEKGSAVLVFVDDVFKGEVNDPGHGEGPKTYEFHSIGSLDKGHHKVAILSESLGYNNILGRWGAGTGAKVKGITGDVLLSWEQGNQSLVGGDDIWMSSPGLNGGEAGFCKEIMKWPSPWPRPLWSTAMFNTPAYDPSDQALYLNITLGRGHFWLNGHDLGRFWNITRGESNKYSQQYYFLPFDLLDATGSDNQLVFFDALGSDLSSTTLVLSWLEKTDFPNLQDEVDYPEACI